VGWIGIITLLSIAAAALPFALSLFCRYLNQLQMLNHFNPKPLNIFFSRPQQRLLAMSSVSQHSSSQTSPPSSLPSTPSVGSIIVIVLILQLMSVALCGYPLPKTLQVGTKICFDTLVSLRP
jgi:hypothetical protein